MGYGAEVESWGLTEEEWGKVAVGGPPFRRALERLDSADTTGEEDRRRTVIVGARLLHHGRVEVFDPPRRGDDSVVGRFGLRIHAGRRQLAEMPAKTGGAKRVKALPLPPPQWRVCGLLRRSRGQLLVEALAIQAENEQARDAGLTHQVLQSVSPARIVADAQTQMHVAAELRDVPEELAASLVGARPKRGPHGSPPGFYEQVARLWLQVCAESGEQPRARLRERLSDRLGYEVTTRQVKDWTNQCAKVGLLLPGRPGAPRPCVAGPNLDIAPSRE